MVAHLMPTPWSRHRVGGVDGDAIRRGVAVLDREVVVLEVDVEVREDQPILDVLPDDPRHLVTVELDDRRADLDLRRHGRSLTILADLRT